MSDRCRICGAAPKVISRGFFTDGWCRGCCSSYGRLMNKLAGVATEESESLQVAKWASSRALKRKPAAEQDRDAWKRRAEAAEADLAGTLLELEDVRQSRNDHAERCLALQTALTEACAVLVEIAVSKATITIGREGIEKVLAKARRDK